MVSIFFHNDDGTHHWLWRCIYCAHTYMITALPRLCLVLLCLYQQLFIIPDDLISHCTEQWHNYPVAREMSLKHYNDVIMSAMAFQITSLTIVYATVYSSCRSKKTSKFCVTGLCEGNSPVTGEFPTQRASDAENVSIWWRHHGYG